MGSSSGPSPHRRLTHAVPMRHSSLSSCPKRTGIEAGTPVPGVWNGDAGRLRSADCQGSAASPGSFADRRAPAQARGLLNQKHGGTRAEPQKPAWVTRLQKMQTCAWIGVGGTKLGDGKGHAEWGRGATGVLTEVGGQVGRCLQAWTLGHLSTDHFLLALV